MPSASCLTVTWTERPRISCGTAQEASSGKSPAAAARTRRMSSAKAVTRMNQEPLRMSAPSLRTIISAPAARAAAAHKKEQPNRAPKVLNIADSRPSWRLQNGVLELLLQSVPKTRTHRSEDTAKIRRNMLDCTAFGLEHVGVEHGLPVDPFRRRQILDRQQCRQKAIVRIPEPLSLGTPPIIDHGIVRIARCHMVPPVPGHEQRVAGPQLGALRVLQRFRKTRKARQVRRLEIHDRQRRRFVDR